MGDKKVTAEYDEHQMREFTSGVLDDLQALERMLTEGMLSSSTAEKLARLLLEWRRKDENGRRSARKTFTHEEIAAMIGTSRETVTRILGYFKTNGWISIKDHEITIEQVKPLESITGDRTRPARHH